MRRRLLGAALLAFVFVWPRASALAADPVALEAELKRLGTELATTQERLKALEAQVAAFAASSQATRDALARELSQPVLLLVGEGACPAGFERVPTEAMILTGPRTPKNSALLDAAGLADDEQVGVGSRVYRYLDFCFRAANSVMIK